jgi:hypothetical protein
MDSYTVRNRHRMGGEREVNVKNEYKNERMRRRGRNRQNRRWRKVQKEKE